MATTARQLARAKQLTGPQRAKGLAKLGRIPCRLRPIRQSLGLTLGDVAPLVGLSEACLSAIERGALVSPSHCRALAEFFELAPADIWPGSYEIKQADLWR